MNIAISKCILFNLFKFGSDQDEEEELSGKDPNQVQSRLIRHVCRSRPRIDDQAYDYVLVTDHIKDTRLFKDWLPFIRWRFILDFDPSCSLYLETKESFSVPPFRLRLEDIANRERDDEKFRQRVQYEHRTSWVCCTNEDLVKTQDWLRVAKNDVMKTVNAFTDEDAIKNKKRLVFIFMVATTSDLEKLSHLMTDIGGVVANSDQIIAVSNNATVKRNLEQSMEKIVGKYAAKQSFLIAGWNFLRNMMCDRLNRKRNSESFTIPSASGESGVDIKNETVQKFKEANLDILPSKVVDQYSITDLEDYERSTAVEEFLSGERPTWQVFLPRLSIKVEIPVERNYEKDIVEHIQTMTRNRCNVVQLWKIVHQSGSGATTICMSVLWQLKSKYRCAVIDGDYIRHNSLYISEEINSLSDRIVKFLYLGEDPKRGNNVRCPVLIMLDNANDDIARTLKDAIEQRLRDLTNPIKTWHIIILYLTFGNSVDYSLGMGSQTTFISHSLFEDEKDTFEKRFAHVKEFMRPETMLAFVLMMSEFDTKDNFISKVINNTLKDISDIPAGQIKLLRFLALLGHFCKERCYVIPEKLCRQFLDRKNQRSHKGFLELLKDQVRLFIVRIPNNYNNNTNIRVVHAKLAEVLLSKLSKGKKLSSIALEMLNDNVLFNKRCPTRYFHKTVRRFLTFRADADGHQERDTFSHFIQSLSDDEKIEVFECAYRVLCHEERWSVAQALARLYRDTTEYEKAIEWAQMAASDTKGTKHEYLCQDTLGQITKRKLW